METKKIQVPVSSGIKRIRRSEPEYADEMRPVLMSMSKCGIVEYFENKLRGYENIMAANQRTIQLASEEISESERQNANYQYIHKMENDFVPVRGDLFRKYGLTFFDKKKWTRVKDYSATSLEKVTTRGLISTPVVDKTSMTMTVHSVMFSSMDIKIEGATAPFYEVRRVDEDAIIHYIEKEVVHKRPQCSEFNCSVSVSETPAGTAKLFCADIDEDTGQKSSLYILPLAEQNPASAKLPMYFYNMKNFDKFLMLSSSERKKVTDYSPYYTKDGRNLFEKIALIVRSKIESAQSNE